MQEQRLVNIRTKFKCNKYFSMTQLIGDISYLLYNIIAKIRQKFSKNGEKHILYSCIFKLRCA